MEAEFDCIVRGGTIVTADSIFQGSIAIRNGKIANLIHGEFNETAQEFIDASDKYILPGLIDAHVHFNELIPGEPWEGYYAGSCAAAAGGVTTAIDMPVNERPATSSAELLKKKREFVKGLPIVDYAHWGLIQGDNLDDLEGLYLDGVVGLKAFMVNTDASGFRSPNTYELYQAMKKVAGFGGIVGVHAEDNDLVVGFAQDLQLRGRIDPLALVESRPPVNEVIAIERAARLAIDAGARLHVVHVSCPQGIDAVLDARRKGAQITVETCPQYLSLTDLDLQAIGPIAASIPPVRSQSMVEEMWKKVIDGEIEFVASDHCPCPPAMREAGKVNIWKGWTGAMTLQTMLPVMLTEGVNSRGLSLPALVRLTSFNPAKLFGIYPQKGSLEVGADADFAIVDVNREWIFSKEDIKSYYPLNPYVGRKFKGSVDATYVRGECVYSQGKILAQPGYGKLVTPVR